MSTFEQFQRIMFCATVVVATSAVTVAQSSAALPQPTVDAQVHENAVQIASILRISDLLEKLHNLRAQAGCGSPPSLGELAARQDILEVVETSSLDVDGVLAEIENERAQLFELRAALASRRDRSLGFLNVANIITGAGLGMVTNALQFSNSTTKIGDNIGIVSGLGSTVLSVLAIRGQRGPRQSVGRSPNMLAPLLGRQPQLNTYYPPAVVEYLNSIPVGERADSGSRLDQLTTEWRQDGRIGPVGSAKTDQQIERLTSSLSNKTKLSVDDISDRIAMLSDVAGRVGLMKRDLSGLMKSIHKDEACVGDQ